MTDNEKQIQPILPDVANVCTSSSPHVHCGLTISKIMQRVILCLVPVIFASIMQFRMLAVSVLIFCTAFSALAEYLWCKCVRQRNTVPDCSALVTGLILGLNLPPGTPLPICAVGSFFAIIIVKELFGGLGQNPFNPAAAARVALLLGFPAAMNHWQMPIKSMLPSESLRIVSECGPDVPDFVTGATPLTAAKMAQHTEQIDFLSSPDFLQQAFIGNIGGSIGETSVIAILIGGLGLIAFRLIKWQIPFGMIGFIALFTGFVHFIDPMLTPSPVFHLCTGGVMIGAFFMATDMVTSPMNGWAGLLYGAMIGLLTCIIRIWGSYPEGVSFAILLMNALVPLIDRIFIKHPFGWTPLKSAVIQIRRGEI